MAFYTTNTCLLTDLPARDIAGSFDGYEYLINNGLKTYCIRLPYYADEWIKNDIFFRGNRHIIKGLLLNNVWFDTNPQLITIELLQEFLSKQSYPKTPSEKVRNLFSEIFKLQTEDGGEVELGEVLFQAKEWAKFYFKSMQEYEFYLLHLEKQGIIESTIINRGGIPQRCKITFAGLEYAIKLQTEGDKSNKCFIAMSFKSETKEIREAIRGALIATGYEAVIIDEQNINSDRTINDEIIANLKKSKFCIADFSYHSNGVYFESGFALGQGKKVIYTCSESEFKNAHFDIKPLQHIIYNTPEELTKALIHKIEAFIS